MEEGTPGVFAEYARAEELRAARYAAAQATPFHSWQELCSYYGNRCLSCGKRKKLTRDHVIPKAQSGSNSLSNMQPLCGPCNRAKGNRVIDYRSRDRNAFTEALVRTMTSQ